MRDRRFVENLDDDNKMKKEIYFIDDWDRQRKKEMELDFADAIKSGGSVFGVFNENNGLIAFAVILSKPFGSSKQYVKMTHIHTSYEYRNQGIGKELFKSCIIPKAKEFGAEKIYISSNFSEETQCFYKSLGCTDAQEIDKESAEKEPYDRQLEYPLWTH
ncbi:MAG: GNAT family N-acetyltransferase [Treponema sp.]|nr:GNAT family N-acetyltransferase [Treponema sp.]